MSATILSNANAIRTTCPYCGVGCGVLAERAADGSVTVRGDPAHPANFGRLCTKGTALADTLGLETRLLHPEINGERVAWPAALDHVAHGFQRIRREHGPEAVAFYVSGQLLTEDYYVANKLMKGFIGSANIDTNSRLCMASSVAGHKRAFGADVVPLCYDDLDAARLIVLVGSNTAWCHPILFQRIAQARAANGVKVVVIDPRRTATCAEADLHLPLAPGTDTLLFNGLLAYLAARGDGNGPFINAYTEGLDAALDAARAASIETVAADCGLPPADVAEFYRWFAETEKTVSVYSQGVNQSSSGTDKVNAIINCHLYTGRIGRPGMGPFSFTGQPNAMGGREVGALANQLAAHMDFAPADVDRVRRFWDASAIATQPGLKAVDLFRAVEAGKVKALWIMATNPAVSMPDADRVRRALGMCELVVVSDCVRRTDTSVHAHVRLPALAWGEKDGTVTNSERRVSRCRQFLEPPGEAKPDWWILSEVARRMGFGDAFGFTSAADIFREHAALSAFENGGARAFDLGALAEMSNGAYDALAPTQWPATTTRPTGRARMLDDGRFYTPTGKARFVAITPRAPTHAPDAAFPLALNTGRVRDHWHTLTRTALSPRLSGHTPEPCAELHPADAESRRIVDGELVRITTQWGAMIARARVTTDQRRGSVFVPMHWSDAYGRGTRADALVNPAADPISGQPEFKHTPANVARYAPAWQGFVLSRRPLAFAHVNYCVSVKGVDVWRYELASETPIAAPRGQLAAWRDWSRQLVGGSESDWLEYADTAAGHYRAALLDAERLVACVYLAADATLPPRDWLLARFADPALDAVSRAHLLAGFPPGTRADRPVCNCFNVGRAQILAAVADQGLASVEAIGRALGAGTQCGSCRPELALLLKESQRA